MGVKRDALNLVAQALSKNNYRMLTADQLRGLCVHSRCTYSDVRAAQSKILREMMVAVLEEVKEEIRKDYLSRANVIIQNLLGVVGLEDEYAIEIRRRVKSDG
jgi:hypothetical protein